MKCSTMMEVQEVMEQDFEKRLKRIRKERKYTQQQLADIAGLTLHSISNYEQGISKPITKNLLELAKSLDVTPEYLLLGDNNMNNYTLAIKRELLQINDYEKISQIKNEKLNSTILSHLEMSEELIHDIKFAWNNAGIFKKRKDNTVEMSYCTRNYVQEVILRYCQNRAKYKDLYKLNDGMLLGITS